MANLPEMYQYRLPLTLRVSEVPLWLGIDCPRNFPISRPNLVVLARVVHKDVHPQTKVISTVMLDQWDLHRLGSNLLNVIRDIHARFDSDAPIPEKMIKEGNVPASL